MHCSAEEVNCNTADMLCDGGKADYGFAFFLQVFVILHKGK